MNGETVKLISRYSKLERVCFKNVFILNIILPFVIALIHY